MESTRRAEQMASSSTAYAETAAANRDWFKLDDPAEQRFGRRTFKVKNEFDTWDYNKHGQPESASILARQGKALCQQGTRTTRFHDGFSRRNHTSIRPEAARVQRNVEKEAVRVRFEPKRTNRLDALDRGYNQFNIITGQQNAAAERRRRPQARHLDETKSRSLIHEGTISLRDSTSRFFGPPPGCQQPAKHRNRALNFVSEGLQQPLFSSELGVGRFEMPSWGAADAFGHSRYGGHSLYSRPATGMSATERPESRCSTSASMRLEREQLQGQQQR